MAGQTHRIDIGDDDLLPPWSTVFEVAAVTAHTDWVLVGGLMVQVHAHRAGIESTRPTKDVDMVLDVTSTAVSLSSLGIALHLIGFEPLIPDQRNRPIYRFERGPEQIDVMVADHLPKSISTRYRARPAFEAPAGAQAIARKDTVEILSRTVHRATISVPDILGAVIAKGAAHFVDTRDPGRHLEDAAVLITAIDAVGDLALDTLSKNDRKRLVHLAVELGADAPAWDQLEPEDRTRGRQNLERLIRAGKLNISGSAPGDRRRRSRRRAPRGSAGCDL